MATLQRILDVDWKDPALPARLPRKRTLLDKLRLKAPNEESCSQVGLDKLFWMLMLMKTIG